MSRRLVTILVVALLCEAGLAAVQWNAKLLEEPSDAPLIVRGSFTFDDVGLACCIFLVIFNRTEYPVTIIWDESSIVLPWGESSRVVLGSTRFINIGLPQAPTVIPPRSYTALYAWPESEIRSTSVLPIVLFHGAKIRLYLAWQSQEQKGFSYWEWVFERLEKEEPQDEKRTSGKRQSEITPKDKTPQSEKTQEEKQTPKSETTQEEKQIATTSKLSIGFGVMWLWPYSSLWKEEMPPFFPWAFFGRFTENSFLGLNLLLGVSYRGYFADIQAATNLYWGIGTWLFVFPYVEAGVSFLRENLAVAIGLIWYLPYTSIVLRF